MFHKCSELLILKQTEYYDIARSIIEDWNKRQKHLDIDEVLANIKIQFQTDKHNEFTICTGFKFSNNHPVDYFTGCTKRVTYLNTVNGNGKRIKIKDKPNINYGKKIAFIRAMVSYLNQRGQVFSTIKSPKKVSHGAVFDVLELE